MWTWIISGGWKDILLIIAILAAGIFGYMLWSILSAFKDGLYK